MFYLYLGIALAVVAVVLILTSSAARAFYGKTGIKSAVGKTVEGERYVLNNYLLPAEEGEIAEVPHIVIQPNGIFVVETVNVSGEIHGKEERSNWLQMLGASKVRHRFPNPIHQSKLHVRHVQEIVGAGIPVSAEIVFVQGNISHVHIENVCKPKALKAVFARACEKTLTAEEMKNAYIALQHAEAKDLDEE